MGIDDVWEFKQGVFRFNNPILTGWKKVIFYREGVFRPPNYLRNYNSYDNETCTVLWLKKGESKNRIK